MKKIHRRMLAVLLGAATAVSLAAPAFADGEAMPDFPTEGMAGETEEAAAYTLTLQDMEHGSMFFYGEKEDCRKKSFLPGESVLLAAVPEEGYVLCRAVLAYDGSYEELHQNEEGLYMMSMPEADAAVEAEFEETGPVPEEEPVSDEAETGIRALITERRKPYALRILQKGLPDL